MSLLARVRADQLIFEDTSGTDSCENGDGLAAWGIYEGSQTGSLFVQSTSGNRPTWNSSDGGYPSVSVSASHTIALAHSSPWVLTSFSWMAVVKVTENLNTHLWGRGASWVNAGVYLYSGGGAPRFINFHTGYSTRMSQLSKPDTTATTWFVAAGTADSECIKLHINRQSSSRHVQAHTVNFGTSPLTLFGDGSTYRMTGAAREFAFWDVALTANEMAAEIDAAMGRWGVTNTIAPPDSVVRPSHPMYQQVIG